MIAVFADAFYFLALVNSDDPAHQKARELSQRPWRIVTTAWVITEVGDALCSPENRPAFLEVLAILEESPDAFVIGPSQELFEKGLVLYRERMDKGWSLTDCISFEVMRDIELQDALTADRHFTQAGYRTLFR